MTSSTGNGASTLALKAMDRINQSPKQRVPLAPQNGDIVTAKIWKKEPKCQSPLENGNRFSWKNHEILKIVQMSYKNDSLPGKLAIWTII